MMSDEWALNGEYISTHNSTLISHHSCYPMRKIFLAFAVITALSFNPPPESSYHIALLKYGGGGDWYANLETSLANLVKFCNDNIGTNFFPAQAIVEPGSPEIFDYPFVHMTGHGNFIFNTQEAENLRKYLPKRLVLTV